MVQTRSQTTAIIQSQNDNLVTQRDPSILGSDEPATGKPLCYLAWGRFMTTREYNKSIGKTFEEVTMMMLKKKTHPQGWTNEQHYMGMGGQCGQSCPCCRKKAGDILGACAICK